MQKRRTNNQRRRKATAVQITVYVVKQRRPPKLQLLSSNLERRGSHRHLSPLKAPAAAPAGSPYDRKAQLLLYSQQLRATATFLNEAGSSSTPKPQPHHHHKSKQHLQIITATAHHHNPPHNKVQLAGAAGHRLQLTTNAGNPHQKDLHDPTFPWKVVEVEQKSSVAAEAKLPPPPPSCFGDWKKLFFPSFCAKDVGHVKRRTRKKKTMVASLGRKISAIMMSSRMEKERIGVIAKFLSVIGKHR